MKTDTARLAAATGVTRRVPVAEGQQDTSAQDAEDYRREQNDLEAARAFLLRLKTERGSIVSSGDCSEIEIAEAQSCRRFHVDQQAFGYVLRIPQLTHHPREVEEMRALGNRAIETYVEQLDRMRHEFREISDTLDTIQFRAVPRLRLARLLAIKGANMFSDPEDDREDPRIVGYPH